MRAQCRLCLSSMNIGLVLRLWFPKVKHRHIGWCYRNIMYPSKSNPEHKGRFSSRMKGIPERSNRQISPNTLLPRMFCSLSGVFWAHNTRLSQSIWRRRNLLSSKQMDWRYCLNVQLRWPYMTINIELNDAFESANVFDWHILERKWAQFSLSLTVRRLTRQCILKLSRKRRALMNGCRQVDLERSSPSLADVLCGLSERLR